MTVSKVGEDAEHPVLSYSAGEKVKWSNHFGELTVSLKS